MCTVRSVVQLSRREVFSNIHNQPTSHGRLPNIRSERNTFSPPPLAHRQTRHRASPRSAFHRCSPSAAHRKASTLRPWASLGFPQTQHALRVSISTRIAQTAAVGQTSGAKRPAVPWALPSTSCTRDQCAGRYSVSSAVHDAVGLARARIAWIMCRHSCKLQPHRLAAVCLPAASDMDSFPLTQTLP